MGFEKIEKQVDKNAVRLQFRNEDKQIVFEIDVVESKTDKKVIYVSLYKPLTIALNITVQRELNNALVNYTFQKMEKYVVCYLNTGV